MPDNLYNEFYFVKFVKCIIIIMFTQFSGFFVVTTYAQFMDQKSDVGNNWLLAGVITSLATIILNFFLSQIIKKLWLIVAGQGFMAAGLIMFAIQLKNSFLIGSCLFFFGYSLGIGINLMNSRNIHFCSYSIIGSRYRYSIDEPILMVLYNFMSMSCCNLQQQRTSSWNQ